MEEILRALLSIRASDFEPMELSSSESSFKSIGLATSIHDFEIHSRRIFIWHAPAGILPITRSELDRFEMDSPKGFHLILSERTTHPDCEPIDESKMQIVSPKQISLWIGNAVLSGELIASITQEESIHEEPDLASIQSNEQEIQVLRSKIDIESWTESRGIEGFSSSPMLLEALIWKVSGDLKGPSGSSEKGEWTILEDPWSQRLSIIGNSEKMHIAPKLRSASPPNENWLSEDRLKIEISKIVEERRRGESGEVSISGSVRSMLLERWVLDLPMASIEQFRTFIPGWLIHLDSEKILHGRNGRLYDSVSLK